jgi:hypothetical protein
MEFRGDVLAILGDIHGNLDALLAVGEDALRHGVTEVYCLGDIAGHGGPNPRECVELAMGWSVVLQGNQDLALFRDLDGYPDSARKALYWAAAELRAPVPSLHRAKQRLDFLQRLPARTGPGSSSLPTDHRTTHSTSTYFPTMMGTM